MSIADVYLALKVSDYIIIGFCILSFIIFIVHKINKSIQYDREQSLIQALSAVAENLRAGNSLETIMVSMVGKKEYKCTIWFSKIIELTNKGTPLILSFEQVARKSGSEVFIFVSEVITLTYSSKGNIVDTLHNLSNKLNDIAFLQQRIDEKSNSALTSLQLIGMIGMPIIFYALASFLSSELLIIEVDLNMKVYFGALTLLLSMLSYLIFDDIIDSFYNLLLGVSSYLMIIFILGPNIGNILGIV
jgi:Flp pilus assembly protein TadB